MKELTLPSLSDELQQYLMQPPHPEYRNGVAEAIVFLEDEEAYVDEYATEAARRQFGPQTQEIKASCLHFLEHRTRTNAQGKTSLYPRTVTHVCSTGPKRDHQCLGCALKSKGADVPVADRWAWEVLHAAWYHLTPYVKNGQVVLNKEKQPIILRNECQTLKFDNEVQLRADAHRAPKDRRGRTCAGCQNTLDLVFGARRIIKVGSSHFDNILKTREVLKTSCRVCGTRTAVLSYHCVHCGSVLVDMSTVQLTPDEVNVFTSQNGRCPQCGREGLPVPKTACGYNQDYSQFLGGCAPNAPTSMKLTDVALRLQREGKDKDSHIVCRGFQPLEQAVVPQLPDWFATQFKGQVKTSPGTSYQSILDSDVCNPAWELDKMYSPVSIADQEEIFKVHYPV
jgi:hypothetical protein